MRPAAIAAAISLARTFVSRGRRGQYDSRNPSPRFVLAIISCRDAIAARKIPATLRAWRARALLYWQESQHRCDRSRTFFSSREISDNTPRNAIGALVAAFIAALNRPEF